jgi:hypothetical protein
MNIPSFIFIVPYRDRLDQMEFFKKQMNFVLEDTDPNRFHFFFIHQCDDRSFNRGAMKNIGFLAMKAKYPHHYQNITFVFNDVDTTPVFKNMFQYETTSGIIKHFYGFRFALGGIVSILGKDFEKMNGFPNYWGWGYEDNLLQKRAFIAGLSIDRSHFFPVKDPRINQLHHGSQRSVNKRDFQLYAHADPEGISDITHLNYTEEDMFIQVSTFSTGRDEISNLTKVFDLTTGSIPFKSPRMGVPTLDMILDSHPIKQNTSHPIQTPPKTAFLPFLRKSMVFK